ncbi:MAG: hypothetical protein KatS3mg111_2169 [Pirellulaceae bacterium]|nr:MAG: hypothetical protein KatS3mg111_2169 [Pirellulaceae bacterium]
MRMLSGRLHWLTMGLALLMSAQGFTSKNVNGQTTYAGGYAQQPAGPVAGTSYAMPGPAPGGVVYASAQCDLPSGCSGGSCAGACGGQCSGGCGVGGAGLLQGGLLGRLGISGPAGYCGYCGGAGCPLCGGDCHYLFGGRLHGVLGLLAPYAEGGSGQQRWFDVYGGTIGLARTSDFGGFSSNQQDLVTGQFVRQTIVSKNGQDPGGIPVLSITDLDMDKIRYGLELIANLQTGVGSHLEFRYFGLNDWDATASANTISSGNPTLYSVFSDFGTNPPGGFDDTDRSFIHTLNYNSELHNGEINFRRHWVGLRPWLQGSFLGGLRYIDLDERLTFSAVGSNNNTFTFNQLRFFDMDTITRNQLVGFQVGGDLWVAVMPGMYVGAESKAGIYGNHHEVQAHVMSNSIPGGSAQEFMQDGQTAYAAEFVASVVYRLTYSWSVKASYNLFYLDNVALAPENFNTRDLSNAIGGGAFTANRAPFIDADGEVAYNGWSIGAEWLW